jgi:hypothetical protein
MNAVILRKVTLLVAALCISWTPVAAQQCTPDVVRVRSSIQSKYRSQDDPNFDFIQSSPTRNIREGLEELGRGGFEVRDFADLNVDVSYVYSLKHGREAWRLCLSMVGPFAALFRLSRNSSVLTTGAGATASEREILKVLVAIHYGLLDRRTLSCPSNLRRMRQIQESGSRRIVIWQALFREEERLPWR